MLYERSPGYPNSEEAMVKFMLSTLALPEKVKWLIIRRQRERTGNEDLHFPAFLDFFRDFPLYLMRYDISNVPSHFDLRKMFTTEFSRKAIFEYYHALRSDYRHLIGQRRFAMHMPWPYLKGGVCLHDYRGDQTVGGWQCVWTASEGRVRLFLEPFAQLLRRLQWDPPVELFQEVDTDTRD